MTLDDLCREIAERVTPRKIIHIAWEEYAANRDPERIVVTADVIKSVLAPHWQALAADAERWRKESEELRTDRDSLLAQLDAARKEPDHA